jgi:lysophospholipase L1-like esterase
MPPVSTGPQFSTRRSLLYSTIIVVALLGLAEGVLRLVGVRPPVRPRLLLRAIDDDIDFPFMQPDAELFWSPRPGFRGAFRGRPVAINALGLRGPEVQPRPDTRRRMLCFGDSITFGYGVGDEETYAFRLGQLLAPRGVEVVNAGVTGYTSHQVVGLARRLVPRLPADVATICIGWNDGTARPVDDREYARRLRSVMAVESRLDRLYLYRAMKRVYLLRQARPAGPRTAARRVPEGAYRENLTRLLELLRAHGVRPAFIELPRRRQRGQTPVESPYPAAFAAFAREHGVPWLRAGSLGYGAPIDDNASDFIDTLHFSPSGHARLAELLSRQLVECGLLDDTPARAPPCVP